MIRTVLRFLGWLILLLILGFVGLLTFSTVTDYSPDAGSEEKLETQMATSNEHAGDTLRILIWNVGYCGLGAEMDFFNDGGKMVRPKEEQVAGYLKAVSMFLGTMKDSVDFALLQEVDRNSKRSYFADQVPIIAEQLNGFSQTFALNYDVKFVPVPFQFPYTPYGKTYSGLLSLSRFNPTSSLRVQYPGGFGWPTKLYMLDRCALEQRFKLKSGKELLLVNTHNTAYDETGEIKKIELEFMKKRYENEAPKGVSVIIGGDWNQVPPSFSSTAFSNNISDGYTPQALDKSMLPAAFKVSYDSTLATNRSNVSKFEAGKTYTTLIDYFVSSPNVEIISVRTIDMQFRWSDHQPVILNCVVK
jgi:endonuclease/exonuclease/phosphatase family metal-dependent hydrolase